MGNRNTICKWIGRNTRLSRICVHCQRLLIVCPCFRKGLPYLYKDLYRESPMIDQLLFGGILDIEDTEAQPGNNLDIWDPFCPKSHQHDDFINVDDFSLNHLPEEFGRDPTVYVWIRNCIPMVVKLIRNDDIMATGRACLIHETYNQTILCSNVHCPYLTELGPDHWLHGGIGIITNSHVIRDNNHAFTTRIEFFYNNERRDFIVKELGTAVHFTIRKMDYTVFTCYVHSEDLITMIATFDAIRDHSWQNVPANIKQVSKNYAIVISHPHGAPKKISIGNVVGSEIRGNTGGETENAQLLRRLYDTCERNDALLRFESYCRSPGVEGIELPYSITWYTTPTCAGSSGAPVYMGNTVIERGKEINQAHTHRGTDNYRGFNNCFT